jgi:hypothetical protein
MPVSKYAPMPLASSATEHFDQDVRALLCRCRAGIAQLPDQALPIDCAQLIQRNLTRFFLESNRRSRGIRPYNGRHGSNNNRLQMLIHLIRRNYQARTRLLNFRSMRRLKFHQPDLVPARSARHHRHSLRSNSFVAPESSNNASFSAAPAARKAASHPSRALRTDEMMMQSSCTRNCTRFRKPHCSMSGFGIRTPRELPIRINSPFIGNYIVITCRSVGNPTNFD